MSASLNEIESLSRKAARGAGMSWGLAEEAGKSVRWLCASGLPGPEVLLGLLTRHDGTGYGDLCPEITGSSWHSSGGSLCPVAAGAALLDRAALLDEDLPVTLVGVTAPLLFVPFVAWCAEMRNAPLMVTGPGLNASQGPGGLRIDTADPALSTADLVVAAGEIDARPRQQGYRGEMPPQILESLGTFAHRTYAPETEQSRLAGAGAGLSDND